MSDQVLWSGSGFQPAPTRNVKKESVFTFRNVAATIALIVAIGSAGTVAWMVRGKSDGTPAPVPASKITVTARAYQAITPVTLRQLAGDVEAGKIIHKNDIVAGLGTARQPIASAFGVALDTAVMLGCDTEGKVTDAKAVALTLRNVADAMEDK